MRAGLFSTLQCPAGREAEEVRRFLDRLVRAEQLGFESVWLAERHFTAYGVVGNPAVLAGAIAARTSRVQIGFAAFIVAMHNPYQLAEQIVMLDALSGGRIIAGAGTGQSRVEFAGLGVSRERLGECCEEAIDVLLKVWSGQPFVHEGEFFPADFPGLRMGTVQRPRPRLVRAAVSDSSVESAARRRIPVILASFPGDLLRHKLGVYVAALREDGASTDEVEALLAECAFVRYLVVSGSEREAREIARLAVAGYITRSNEVDEHHVLGSFLTGRCIVGTPDMVLSEIDALRPLGCGRLLCSLDFGGLASDLADLCVERFGALVLPAMQRGHLGPVQPAQVHAAARSGLGL